MAHKGFFSSKFDLNKLDALRTLSPMAYFAEVQFRQNAKIYQNENSLVLKLRKSLKGYAGHAKFIAGSLTLLFILFFLFQLLAIRFRIFRKMLMCSFVFSFLCTILFWWII
jgi:hypothetical protein